ncbi:ABC transporter ATP-binding protein [Brevibacterium yomogidense]|uniref:Duplicated ATPase component YkoD of energizing module of thiamin-regulated ECF transporter for HydroxyMethylPyrimidine n=1 Tax=Brevibacterium yomogidense TaxID=946573 RepID=A0A1X6XHG1_9MICO|nr:ATP-binding cassette domain-containing protein [Brevibacterium yomogidense]SLM98721.1 Duplicated ATPase component YkoD of energizing module of thiamin-regulated ECF transporter for HydroxyMethylPyrimidine [Brevibacterium yomogidense]
MSAPGTSRPARIVASGWGWRHASRRHPAVAGLDLVIEPGERVLLLGPSGAGKSTLLAGLAGILGDTEDGVETGALTLDGVPAAHQRGRAGLVLQDPEANTILPVLGDDVAFGCENLAVPRDEIWRRVTRSLDAVGLRHPLDRPTAHLSGGERQRLAIAGVLAMSPGLLLLDEPTANLDHDGAAEVRRAVAQTSTTLVVVDHRVDEWLGLVDRVVVLEPAGGLIADGPPDAVFARAGSALEAAGVWVPGSRPHVPRTPPLPRPSSPDQPPPRSPVGPGPLSPASPSPADPPLLTAAGVAVGHGGSAVREDLDLEVRAGESLVVTGPNGVGKTTFAFALAGLTAPLAGEVRASAQLARGTRSPHPHRWRARQLLTRIGTVFQRPEHQFVTRSVREELAVGPRLVRAREQSALVDELLERLRLTHLAQAHPYTLSGGEQRRLSVATVLATAPRVLVLDEPTFGQDRTTWTELAGLVAAHVDAGGAAVSVTHDEDYVRVLGDRRFHLEAAPLESQSAAQEVRV